MKYPASQRLIAAKGLFIFFRKENISQTLSSATWGLILLLLWAAKCVFIYFFLKLCILIFRLPLIFLRAEHIGIYRFLLHRWSNQIIVKLNSVYVQLAIG